MTRIFALVSLLVCGCRSFTPTPESLAIELLRSDPPAAGYRAITEDIGIDQAALDALRSHAESSDGRIVGLAHFSRGVHPYGVIVFHETANGLIALETLLYWGRVDEKWRGSVSRAEIDGLLEAAKSEFDCRRGRIEDDVFGVALVVWDGEDQLTCRGGWFLEEESGFAQRLQVIMDRAEQTYALRPESPAPGD